MTQQKITRIFGLSVLMAAICLLGGCGTKDAAATYNNTSAVQSPAAELQVWGEVNYNDVYQITIDFPATVERILVKEGDIVQKGDVLAALDISEFEHAIQKAEDQKKAGEALLTGIVQDTAGLEAQIEQQKRDIAAAESDLNNNKALYDIGSLSKDSFDKASDKCVALRTQLTILQTQLQQLQTNNSSSLEQQKSNLDAIQNDLDIYHHRLLKNYLNGDEIICSVDRGIVKSIGVAHGTILGSQIGSNVVMELIDENSLYISAEVEEEFIHEIALNSVLRIVPTADTDVEFTGRVDQIGAMAIEKDGNRIVKVRIIPDDENHVLKPGYTMEVYFKRNSAQTIR